MEFIEVKEEHFSIIQQIAYKTWPNTFKDILTEGQISYMLEMMYSTEAIANQLHNLNHHYLLVKDKKEEYLGYISYQIDYEFSTTKIHKIYVLPETQGIGIGKILLEKIESIAKENSNTILSLNVNRYNKALQFYEHLGFSVQGKEDIDIGNGFLMEDYVLNKNLGNL